MQSNFRFILFDIFINVGRKCERNSSSFIRREFKQGL